MTDLCRQLTEACHTLGYKIKEVEESIITIRHQMHIIYIYFNDNNPDDCTVMSAILKEVPEEARLQVLEHCNSLNCHLKLFKYYIMEQAVVATIEVRFSDNENLKYQLSYAVHAICLARKIYEQDE